MQSGYIKVTKNGCGLVYNVWGLGSAGSYTNSNVASLTNGNDLPIVATMSCLTGGFDSVYNTGNCIGEEFLRNPRGGGIAYVGATRVAWGYTGTWITIGLAGELDWRFWESYKLGITKPGPMLSEAKVRYIEGHNPYTSYGNGYLDEKTVLEYVLLGDPVIVTLPVVVEFYDDFEDQALTPEWTESGEGDWNVEKTIEAHAGYAAHSDNSDTESIMTLATPINLLNKGNAKLTFWRWVDNGLDSGEYLAVDLWDGTKWNQIFYWTNGVGDTDVWEFESHDLSSYLIEDFSIRFRTKESSRWEHVYVDDVKVVSYGVTPNEPPVADANGPYTGTEGVAVTFNGSGSSDPENDSLTYSWNFGDGAIGTGVNPTHTYEANGTYTVTLTVNDGKVDSDLSTTTATISDVDPVAAFSYSPSSPAAGSPVHFIDESVSYDGIASWSWNFGDASTNTSQNPIHTYVSASTYTVSLTVSEADGDSNTTTQSITVSAPNEPPVAKASVNPTTANEGDTVNFDGSGSSDSDGTIESYEWDFGDGTTGTGVSTTHVYADDGTYTVTLIVTDDNGATGTDTVMVTINNVAPTVDAGSDQTVDEGDTVSFSGSLNDPGSGDTHNITWDFGDGSTASDTLTPNHVYADNGIYTVTLMVTDDDGGTGSATCTVTVNNVAPTAEAGGPYEGIVDELITFTGSATDPGTNDTLIYSWDFGDGKSGTGASPTHTYTTNGTYTATLTVTDDDGGVGTDTATVTVTEKTTTKCWSGSNEYLYRNRNQMKKFCKCAEGNYGYNSYKYTWGRKTVYYYVDSGDNENWEVTSRSSYLPVCSVICTDGVAYPTNNDYYG